MSPDAFPAGYRASRETFLSRCREARAVLEAYEHPLPGSDGPPVATDVALCGRPDAQRVLFVVSGTHGVEGLCGAGVQHGLLARGVTDRLGDEVRLVLVHALNPHGFLGLHRTNEDNVDLNRNFVAHDGRYPDAAAYEEIHALLVPEDWDGPARRAADAGLADFLQRRGRAALQAAVTGGQYTHAEGLFYGGRAPAWSNRLWRGLLREHASRATHVAVLDLHSGLGASGSCELISGATAGSVELAAARQYFGAQLVFPGVTSTATSAGGYMGLSLAQELPGRRGALVVAEFGTRPFDEVFAALRADNWLRVHGDSAPAALERDVHAAMQAAFVGSDRAWREAVLSQGYEVCLRALAGLQDDVDMTSGTAAGALA